MAGRGAESAAEAGHHRRPGVSVAALHRALRQTPTLAAGGSSRTGGGTAAAWASHGSTAGTRSSGPHSGEIIYLYSLRILFRLKLCFPGL